MPNAHFDEHVDAFEKKKKKKERQDKKDEIGLPTPENNRGWRGSGDPLADHVEGTFGPGGSKNIQTSSHFTDNDHTGNTAGKSMAQEADKQAKK